MRRAGFAILLLALGTALAGADVPVRAEQVIYSIVAFNGKDYSPTFVPAASDTIYVLANTDNFLSVRHTFVYWWPPAERWQVETSVFNEPESGILEITGGGSAPRLYELQRYTFFNVSGEYEQNWKVAVGDAADAEVTHAREITQAYLADTEAYQRQHEEYLARLREMSSRIEELKAQKKDVSALKRQMDALPAPTAPSKPKDYIVPPAPVQGAFVVDLPPGRYRVRLLNHDAQVLEGSEKWIVSHAARRTNGVGYEVIPSDKWTRPEESKELSSVLYVNGRADLYVTAFFEHEFNDRDYARTTDNGASGNPHIFSWNRIEQVPHASLTLRGDAGGAPTEPGSQPVRLDEQPFYVQQTPGSGLGYTIVPFTGTGDQQGTEANLRAFRLAVQTPLVDSVPAGTGASGTAPRPAVAGPRTFELRAYDESGRFLPGSDRLILVVAPGRGAPILVILSLIPLAIMTSVLVSRARLYSGKRRKGS